MIEDYRSSDVMVTSYDLLKRDIDLYEGKNFLYEIIDEAKYIKNQTTAASKAVKLIQSHTKFALTGTPVFLISLKATDRAHRIGQTKKVTVYKMIAKGTIEEKIMKLQETKKDLADSIISGDNTGMGSLSKEELLELLEIG